LGSLDEDPPPAVVDAVDDCVDGDVADDADVDAGVDAPLPGPDELELHPATTVARTATPAVTAAGTIGRMRALRSVGHDDEQPLRG